MYYNLVYICFCQFKEFWEFDGSYLKGGLTEVVENSSAAMYHTFLTDQENKEKLPENKEKLPALRSVGSDTSISVAVLAAHKVS